MVLESRVRSWTKDFVLSVNFILQAKLLGNGVKMHKQIRTINSGQSRYAKQIHMHFSNLRDD